MDSCHSPEALLAATVSGVEPSGGWSLAADASPNTGEKKWGVETSTPGAAWTVSLDTRVVRTNDDENVGRRGEHAWANGSVVTVAYLASYENMGVAAGACDGACACTPFSVNATWEKPTSELALFEVHTAPPAEDCRITLRLTAGPSEDGDGGGAGRTGRFKVLQMTVQEEFVEADRARAASQEAGGAENAFRANRMTGGG